MSKLLIRLGKEGQRYAQAEAPIKLLGTVQDGMAIGALAQLADGSYAQMNGDFLRPLNTSRVEFAINGKLRQAAPKTNARRFTAAADTGAGAAGAGGGGGAVAPKPVVVVKKRRVVPTPAT
jgi:hypothetical protein